jgi:large subunit ribosomal protein L29
MIKQFREKSIADLEKLVAEWKAQLLALRFQKATGQLQKPHEFKNIRNSIARALTIINEKKRLETQNTTNVETPKAPKSTNVKKEVKATKEAKPSKESKAKAKGAK